MHITANFAIQGVLIQHSLLIQHSFSMPRFEVVSLVRRAMLNFITFALIYSTRYSKLLLIAGNEFSCEKSEHVTEKSIIMLLTVFIKTVFLSDQWFASVHLAFIQLVTA